ncbi:MAG: hypothetical protein Q9170_006743 [Blastenia crenularia]
MPTKRTTRAQARSVQSKPKSLIASEARQKFQQALTELSDGDAKQAVLELLTDWIETSSPQTSKSRLKIIEQWLADQTKRRTTAAIAAKKAKKTSKPKEKPDPPDDIVPGGDGQQPDGVDDGAGDDEVDKDGGAGGGGDDKDDQPKQDDKRQPADEGDNDAKGGDEGSVGHGRNINRLDDTDQAHDGLQPDEEDDGLGGDDEIGEDGGGDDEVDKDGGGGGGGADDGHDNNGGGATDGRGYGGQDSLEDAVLHDGRDDFTEEQDNVQDNRQSARQGDELAEQSHDGRLGENSVRQGIQVVIQSSTKELRSEGLGDDGHQELQDNRRDAVPANALHTEQHGPEEDSHGRDEQGHDPQQQKKEHGNPEARQQPALPDLTEPDFHMDGIRQPATATFSDTVSVSRESSIGPSLSTQIPASGTPQVNTQEEEEGNISQDGNVHPNAGFQDDLPCKALTHHNRRDPDLQGNITPANTSPGIPPQEIRSQDDPAQSSFHGDGIQERQGQLHAPVEDDHGTHNLQDPGKTSQLAVPYAAGGRPGRVRDWIPIQPTPSATHSPTPAQTPLPIQTLTGRSPHASSPSSLPSRDAQGISSLVIAAQLPEPLRLTCRVIDKHPISHTLELLYAMPGNSGLSPSRQGDILSFFGSLFDKASYWTLHNSMGRHAERMGCRPESADGLEVDRKDSLISTESSRSASVTSRSDSGPRAPPLLAMFADQWRASVQFSCQTSTAAVVRLTQMIREEQCYLHWCALQAMWKASDPGRDHDSSHDNSNVDNGEEDGILPLSVDLVNHVGYPDCTIAETDSDALLNFLIEEMERRKSELKLRNSPHYEAHTVKLLKSLVAPYLGLTITGNLWRKTMTMGRAVRAVVQELGLGALAVLKRESIRLLGPEMLERILPTIATNHPELKQILSTIESVYLQPFRSPDPRLRVENVKDFILIRSVEQMWESCASHPNGLNGILGGQAEDNNPFFPGNPSTMPPMEGIGALSNKPQETDLLADLDNDDEAIYDVREFHDLDSCPKQPLAIGNFPPTPPPTAERSGVKRKAEPKREESPMKRLAREL